MLLAHFLEEFLGVFSAYFYDFFSYSSFWERGVDVFDMFEFVENTLVFWQKFFFVGLGTQKSAGNRADVGLGVFVDFGYIVRNLVFVAFKDTTGMSSSEFLWLRSSAMRGSRS